LCRSATTHGEKPNGRNYRVWSSQPRVAWSRDHAYSRRGNFSGSFQQLYYFVRSTIGLLGDSYASCLK